MRHYQVSKNDNLVLNELIKNKLISITKQIIYHSNPDAMRIRIIVFLIAKNDFTKISDLTIANLGYGSALVILERWALKMKLIQC